MKVYITIDGGTVKPEEVYEKFKSLIETGREFTLRDIYTKVCGRHPPEIFAGLPLRYDKGEFKTYFNANGEASSSAFEFLCEEYIGQDKGFLLLHLADAQKI